MMADAFERFRIPGQTAFVTGGGTGLGYAMALGLARAGARVVIGARRQDVLAAAAKMISSDPLVQREVEYLEIDLADRDSVAAAASRAIDMLDGVDIFIGNAAADLLGGVTEVDDQSVDFMLRVNVAANVELTRAFMPHMRAQNWGRILFSSSIQSSRAVPGHGASLYAASKSALNGFAHSVAVDAAQYGITVNSLVLGFFLTDISRGVFDRLEEAAEGAGRSAYETFARMTAFGRPGRCEEIEGLVQLLASDAGSYITGASLPIDGGMGIVMGGSQLAKEQGAAPQSPRTTISASVRSNRNDASTEDIGSS